MSLVYCLTAVPVCVGIMCCLVHNICVILCVAFFSPIINRPVKYEEFSQTDFNK